MDEYIYKVECEVIPSPRPTIENVQKVAQFLGWLLDLYEAEDMDLIACDEELGFNFAQIAEIYQVVLSAVQLKEDLK